MRVEHLSDKLKGMIYGSALGDAWGYKTEFMTIDKILKEQPSVPGELIISDDTQMSIYNIRAIEEIFQNYSFDELNSIASDESMQNSVRKVFAEHHMVWLVDPRNNRAPGMTCMSALEKYSRMSVKITGGEGAWGNNSKGCGTIMRAPWLGVLPLNRDTLVVLSILQSETTHGHSTASISSAVATLLVNDLFNENHNLLGNDEALTIGAKIVEEIKNMDIPLVQNSMNGIEEVEKAFVNASDQWDKFFHSQEEYDMTVLFGEGWVAEEALMDAVAAASLYSPSFLNNSLQGIKRLVYTNGDSDSIAAVGGSFLGAYNGYDSFDYPIEENIEEFYKEELAHVYNFLLSLLKENIDVY